MAIPKKIALMIPLTLALGQVHAATHCVDPAKTPQCFATIQAAVDAAAAGDRINIAENPSPTGYTENVVINTPDLFLNGQSTSSPKQERCPKVIVDGCQTADDPDSCGVNPPFNAMTGKGITVNAEGVVIKGLLVRHFNDGVSLNTGANNTRINGMCFMDNRKHVISNGDPVNNVTVKHSLLRGEDGKAAIQLDGDDHHILYNTFFTTDNGIQINGDNADISKNKFLTSNDKCIGVEGNNAKIYGNALDNCQRSIIVTGDQPDIRNNHLAGADGPAIQLSCSSEHNAELCTGGVIAKNTINGSADNKPGVKVEGDNLLIEKNSILSSADEGIQYAGNNSIIRSNTVQRSGSENTSPGIDIEGSSNWIEYNTVSLNSYVGILNYSGDDNTYRGNRVKNNGRAGIYIKEGDGNSIVFNHVGDNQGEGVANGSAATDTTINKNIVKNNRTDICNNGSIASLVGNIFNTGGEMTPCVVDQ